MADRLMRAQVSISLSSGIPEDAIVNTFHFDQDDNGILPPPDTSYDAVLTSLQQFYGTFDDVLFPASVASVADVKIYDMRDPLPRVPRRVDSIPLANSGGDALPGQVALCCSFAGTYISGTAPASLRGRVYLGPIAVDAGVMANGQFRPRGTTRDLVADGGTSLITPNDVQGSSLTFAIYSPTLDARGANIDDSFNDVQRGWVDDRFDIQRRRGAAVTTRSIF